MTVDLRNNPGFSLGVSEPRGRDDKVGKMIGTERVARARSHGAGHRSREVPSKAGLCMGVSGSRNSRLGDTQTGGPGYSQGV